RSFSCAGLVLSHDMPTTAIYTRSLHDALPILVKHLGDSDIARDQASPAALPQLNLGGMPRCLLNCNVRATHRIVALRYADSALIDRKSTRLNSSHVKSSYAVFCLKQKRRRQA